MALPAPSMAASLMRSNSALRAAKLVVDSVLMINPQRLSQARGLPQNLSNLANSCSTCTATAAAKALRSGSLAADWPVFWIQPPRLR